MDQNPPALWHESPAPFDTVALRSPIVSFRLYDYIAGLDSASVVMNIGSVSFSLSSPCVSVLPAESLITVNTACLGLSFRGGDAVNVSFQQAIPRTTATTTWQHITGHSTLKQADPLQIL
jgi:hypothetical protein